MDTSQIIIVTVLFILDIISTILIPVFDKDEPMEVSSLFVQMLRVICTYTIIIASITFMNDFREKSKGICPEYEKIENVYKLK